MDTLPENPSPRRRALRIALKAGTWLAIFTGVVLMLVVLINLRDADPGPETKALAEVVPSSVPDAQNAFLALVGFDAPAGVDPVDDGARIVRELANETANDPTGAQRVARMEKALHERAPPDGRLKFAGDASTLCDPIDKPCISARTGNSADLQALRMANAELVARYLALQAMPKYVNTSVLDVYSTAPVGYWGPTRRLLMTQALENALTGKAQDALAFLDADMALWRRVLASGAGMIEEMIAVRQLAADVALLSELIAQPGFDVHQHESTLRRMLTPLTPVERNSAPMFKREFQMSARMMNSMHEEMLRAEGKGWSDRLLYRLFFNKDATLDDAARFHKGLQKVAAASPADFVALRDQFLSGAMNQSNPDISWLYNPIGKSLVRIAMPVYPDFIARVFDVAAYVQLIRAQLEARLANIAPDQMTSFLGAVGPDARNPYTGQSFTWDTATHKLSFTPMSNHPWRTFSFSAFVPPPTSISAR